MASAPAMSDLVLSMERNTNDCNVGLNSLKLINDTPSPAWDAFLEQVNAGEAHLTATFQRVFLTIELLELILTNLDVKDILTATQVCKHFKKVFSSSPTVKEKAFLHHIPKAQHNVWITRTPNALRRLQSRDSGQTSSFRHSACPKQS